MSCTRKSTQKTLMLLSYTGDFNGHSQFWWPDGGNTPEGKEIEEMFSFLNMTKVISEPTNVYLGENYLVSIL